LYNLPTQSTDIVDKLNREINAALADAKIKARLADLGSIPTPMSPADYAKLIVAATDKWGRGGQGGQHQAGVSPRVAKLAYGQFAGAGNGTCIVITTIGAPPVGIT
jgi:hypothetical protein